MKLHIVELDFKLCKFIYKKNIKKFYIYIKNRDSLIINFLKIYNYKIISMDLATFSNRKFIRTL